MNATFALFLPPAASTQIFSSDADVISKSPTKELVSEEGFHGKRLANQGEPGIVELCAFFLSRGVGIEAGLLSAEDARTLVRSGLAPRCRRVLIEPLDEDEDEAVRHATLIEDMVLSAGIQIEQVHHGYGMACWKVNQRAVE